MECVPARYQDENLYFHYDRRFIYISLIGCFSLFLCSYVYLSRAVIVKNNEFSGYSSLAMGLFIMISAIHLSKDLSIFGDRIFVEKRFFGITFMRRCIPLEKVEKIERHKNRKHIFYLYLYNGKKLKISNLVEKNVGSDPEVSAHKAIDAIYDRMNKLPK